MKNVYLILLLLATTLTATAQKKEKIKGTKVVTVTQKEVAAFDKIEVEDNIELYLVKGDKPAMEIEADENLHEAVLAEVNGSTLRIFTAKEAIGYKKLIVRITYGNDLKSITARHEAIVNALSDLDVPAITVKNLDYSKSFLNVKAPEFALSLNDKAKAEINVKGESTSIDMSKNTTLKALIATHQLRVDLYQKASAQIEGDAAFAKVRLDNNAVLKANKLTAKNLEYTAEGYASASILAIDMLSISAKGKSETELYGTAKIDVKVFNDNALLLKKEQKP